MINKKIKIMFLPASFHFKKNQILAIDLLEAKQDKYPELVLHLAGSGYDRKRLQQIVDIKGLTKKVIFSNVLQGNDLISAYKNAFVTLVCSNSDSEGFSLTALESLIYKTPVIVSSCAGISYFLRKNEIGIVKDPTLALFSEGFEELTKNYSKYKKQTNKIKKIVKNNFSDEVVYNKFISYIIN